MDKLIKVLLAFGFEKEGYGLKVVSTNTTHWVSLLGNKIQSYAYSSQDSECEKIYDTGQIFVTEANRGKVLDTIFFLFENNE